MVTTLLVGCLLLAAAPADATRSDADLDLYREAKAQAKSDPDAHVRLALWCEAHGLEAERIKHLAIAVLASPAHAKARALLGLVAFKGQWQRPAQVAKKVQADQQLAAALALYNEKRAKAQQTAESQWQLALWCEGQGLKAEATAHLTNVVRLDPKREEAWKHLGYKKRKGQWMTDAQLSAAKADAEAQRKADLHWKTALEKLQTKLANDSQRDGAQAALAQVTDPRAVPAVCQVFGNGTAADQLRAVQVLGQIDSPGASRALAVIALFGKTDDARGRATQTLKFRDARGFADLIIGLLREKIIYEVRPVSPGSPGELFVKGQRFNVKRLYPAPVHPNFPYLVLMPGDKLGLDDKGMPVIERHGTFEVYAGSEQGRLMSNNSPAAFSAIGQMPAASVTLSQFTGGWQLTAAGFGGYDNGMQAYNPINVVTVGGQRPQTGITTLVNGPSGVVNPYYVFRQDGLISISQMMAEAGKADTVSAQKRLDQDTKFIDDYNNSLAGPNERATTILQEVSGQSIGPDREAWKAWWVDQLGYSYSQKTSDETPTVVETVAVQAASTPSGFQGQTTAVGYYQRKSCFGAGTLVHTRLGNLPIETLQVGDQVLSQDSKTGALGYQPILVVHHNPPSKTFAITLGKDTVISSPFHRFWKAGKGWVMARDLETGDTIRTVDGLAKVTSKDEGQVQPVFNLDVAETASFFVGSGGVLVHDNSLPAPVLAPFDAEPALARSGR